MLGATSTTCDAMGFLDDLYRDHGSAVEEQLSSQFGLTREQAAKVLPQAAPVILGGLKHQAQQRGPEAVEREVEQLGGGLDLSDLASVFGGGAGGVDPSTVFGSKSGQAQEALANRLGVSPEMAARLLPMLIPVVMGALAKAKAGGAGGQGAAGGIGGLLGILDQNGDGSVMDDIARMAGGAGKAGCLSAILGGGRR